MSVDVDELEEWAAMAAVSTEGSLLQIPPPSTIAADPRPGALSVPGAAAMASNSLQNRDVSNLTSEEKQALRKSQQEMEKQENNRQWADMAAVSTEDHELITGGSSSNEPEHGQDYDIQLPIMTDDIPDIPPKLEPDGHYGTTGINITTGPTVMGVEPIVPLGPTVMGVETTDTDTTKSARDKKKASPKLSGGVRPGAVSIPGGDNDPNSLLEEGDNSKMTPEEMQAHRTTQNGLRKKQDTHPAVQRTRQSQAARNVATVPHLRHDTLSGGGSDHVVQQQASSNQQQRRRSSTDTKLTEAKRRASAKSAASPLSHHASMRGSRNGQQSMDQSVTSSTNSNSSITKGLRGTPDAARRLSSRSRLPDGGVHVPLPDLDPVGTSTQHDNTIIHEEASVLSGTSKNTRNTIDPQPNVPAPTWSPGGDTTTNNSPAGSPTPMPVPNHDEGLAVADMVPDEDFNDMEVTPAQPYNVEQAQRDAQLRKRQLRKRYILVVGVLALLMIGGALVVVFVVIGVGGDTTTTAVAPGPAVVGASNGNNATQAPTQLSTLFPLPDYTMNIMEQDPSSPQARAYQWVIEDPAFDTHELWRLHQRFALATFFYSTNGREWQNNANWLDYNTDECRWWWTGRRLRETQCLYNETVNQHYEYLYMEGNDLDGTIPRELELMTEGTIPNSFFESFIHLKRFFANVNEYLTGTIPTEVGLLSNTLEIFFMGLCTNMKNFSAFLNPELTGPLPSEYGAMSQLAGMYFGENAFTGAIPSEYGRMTSNRRLVLYHNQLNSTIPTELGTMSNLFGLWLDHNSDLSGTIPAELAQVSTLSRILVNNASLSGTVPTVLENLEQTLEVMDVSGNQGITGVVPEGLCNVADGVRWISRVAGRHIGEFSDGSDEYPLLTFDCSASLCGCGHCGCSGF
ncbi:Leucine Rich Repeat [Seminavis robusta]|uniref:Leucine Rich Repeat n=1 Tax=Seminavis robusta TaxID=568900 RepID=A0A9N8E4B9_9STRA|nr:Leucine Rich Repeat [Seminavis robusta]|eukprot:Sro651_g181580.1 Leucine Rich Repeat (909) ;mRNA; r:32159-35338